MAEGADYYTGLVAELYSPLRSVAPDPEPYALFVGVSGEPALELGCGDGDPLLDLVERGLEVEGLDSSGDMLDRCRAAADRRGLDVVLHHASMDVMDLGRTYRSIYLAGPTFDLLPDDAVGAAALARIHHHLEPGGSALVPLFVPAPTPAHLVGRAREHADGETTLRFTILGEERDEVARTQVAHVRYERLTGDAHEVEERDWLLHWYSREGFAALAAAAGLEVRAVLAADGRPAAIDAEQFTFWLARPEA